MSREDLITEINRRLALFKATRREADYPTLLIRQAMQRR